MINKKTEKVVLYISITCIRFQILNIRVQTGLSGLDSDRTPLRDVEKTFFFKYM